jgi:tRNA dimethylallyltransferase
MITKRPSLAVIAGPTASGKSAVALKVAQRTGGVIVNADSAQIYRDLPILSAAPTEEERRSAEHRLYGVLDGATPCSAADWAAMAKREIAEIHGSGRLPILVGGTGLYLRTLLDGIAPVPPIHPTIRAEVRSAPTADNHRRLKECDTDAAARLNPNDSTRIARALEVALSTGRTLSEWQKERTGGIGDAVDLKPIILLPPRAWLYERCDARFRAMVDAGAVDEVRALMDRNLEPAVPVMRAIGVPELSAYLRSELSLEEAIVAGQAATRQYAKRQYTWFNHQPPSSWQRVSDPAQAEDAIGL